MLQTRGKGMIAVVLDQLKEPPNTGRMRQAPNKISFLVDHDRHVTSHRDYHLLREKRCHQIKEFAVLPIIEVGQN